LKTKFDSFDALEIKLFWEFAMIFAKTENFNFEILLQFPSFIQTSLVNSLVF